MDVPPSVPLPNGFVDDQARGHISTLFAEREARWCRLQRVALLLLPRADRGGGCPSVRAIGRKIIYVGRRNDETRHLSRRVFIV
jgi:hypothetical protein